MNKAQERRWPSPANGGNAAVSGPAAVAAAAARAARLPRVMPHWVSASGRNSAAAPPPPPPSRPEPDYEVIEFPSDQYVNAKLNPAPRPPVSQHCGLCGAPGARMRCLDCEGRVFCVSCDDMYHRHPKRRAHRRKPIITAGTEESDRPPLPPKGAGGAQAAPPPVPPPRRNKVGGRSDSFSSRGSRTPTPVAAHAAPPPTPAHLRRPLPAAPPAAAHHLMQHSMAPSAGIEANNTWSRPSTAASFTSPPASPHPLQHAHEPQAWPGGGGGGGAGGWSSATVDRRRSAAGAPGGGGEGALRRAPLASSVFELHRPELHPQQLHQMHQQRFMPAQSMATLSCASCAGCQQQRAAAAAAAGGEWWRYGSNVSLDARLQHEGYPHAPPGGVWVNPWLPPMPMYPHTHHTTGRPSSRAHSRTASRAASPAASVRSRRSRQAARRYREPDDYSDDEDSSGERRGPRRRDSLRSAPARNTPSPVPRRSPAPQPAPARRQDFNQDSTLRNGDHTSTRRDSSSSYAPRESPVRTHAALRESPIRTNTLREESPRVPLSPTSQREVTRVPLSPTSQRDVTRVPLSPTSQRDVTRVPLSPTSQRDVTRVPLSPTNQREMPRVPLSPTSQREVRVSPVERALSNSSEEPWPNSEPTPTPAQDALDAPPPPVPTARWQCEYCTYVNEPGTRVCEICCKTPTAPPRPASTERATLAPPSQADRLAAATDRLTISEPAEPNAVERASEPQKTKKGEDDYKNVRVDKAQGEVEQGSATRGSPPSVEPSAEVASLGVKRVKKKSNCEKVSTGCGPSPPREAPQSPVTTPASPAPATPVTPSTASTGTSPLPQSISTQTYESPEEIRQAAASSGRPTSSTADESSRSTRRRSARSLRRDARRSARRSPDHTSRSERSHSRHSFSSDTRSIGTPTREWSPAPPAVAPDEEWWREAGPLRSRSNSLLQHQRPRAAAPPRRAPPRRASHLDLYRERDDPRWRRPDAFGDPYAYPDPRDAYGSQPDVTRAISLEALAAARRQTDVVRSQGMELVKLLREAEASGFTAEEVHAATQQCGAAEPVRWLQENWAGMVGSVQTVASKLGREAGAGDTVGTLSEREARDALRRHKGSVWQAVTDCVQQRQRKYGELMSRGKFSREEVLTCLTAHHGDLEAAYLDLTKNQLKPFLMKIWGPPEGVENDSAPSPHAPGPSGALPTYHVRSVDNQNAEEVNVTYLDKLKKFETILNKDANVHIDESVSENYNRFEEHNPQVQVEAAPTTSVQETIPAQDNATDVLGGLKSLLSHAGIAVSNESLLQGLRNIMQMGIPKSQISENSVKNQYEDFIDTENDFIQAYNALTSSSPLPSIDGLTERTNNVSIISNIIATAQTATESPLQGSSRDVITNSIREPNSDTVENVSKHSPSTVDRKEFSPKNFKSDKRSTTEKSSSSNSQTRTTTSENPVVSQESKQDRKQEDPKMHRANGTQRQSSRNNDEIIDERSQHLSDIVNDTHRLVQQMKDEINSDMASYDEGGPNSESENESSATPESSERDSYSEDSESSSENEDEASDELTERSDHKDGPSKPVISKLPEESTSSDENEQFEEAMDNSETLSADYEESNMAALDAIVKSLQEMDTNIITREASVASQPIIIKDSDIVFPSDIQTENNVFQGDPQITNYAIIEAVTPQMRGSVIIVDEVEGVNEAEFVTEVELVINSDIIAESAVVINSGVIIEPEVANQMAISTEPEVLSKNELVTEPEVAIEIAEVNVSKIIVENDIVNSADDTREVIEDNAYVQGEETEDYNNNVLSVKTFEELYESLSMNQPHVNNPNENGTLNNRSPTPEVIIRENLPSNEVTTILTESISTEPENQDIHRIAALTPNHINATANNKNEIILHTDTNNLRSNSESSDISSINSNEDRLTPESNTASSTSEVTISKNDNQNNSSANSEPSDNVVSQKMERASNETFKIVNGGDKPNQTKSNIPKPKTSSTGPKSENKPPTKVIISKVPVRKNSLKQPTSPPTSQKSHFGNIQSGHVKKLQSSLFGKNESKNPKIPVPVRKKTPPKSGLALVKPMPSKIITIQSDNSAEKAKLKPYFQETCLSDDYLTETDDEAVRRSKLSPRRKSEPAEETATEPEPEPLPITSRLVNGTIIDFTQVILKDGSPERQVRMLVAEGVVETWQQAEVAVALAARGEAPAAALLAAHDCADLSAAIAYLKQECELCAGHAPAYEMVSMLACTHRCCSECASTYFTVQITERSIFDCVCPFCKLPALSAASAPEDGGTGDHEDEALEYFSRLEHLLKTVVEAGVHELFQRKLRDRALLQDPNFKWCIECSSGFFVHPRQKRVTCPECRSVTCARCRKPWEKQHEGLSCDQFAEWKEANDPETSLAAVQRHLQDNGIDCPKCRFRYSLARGGCMHFTCSQCKYEFCCGCGKPFTMGARCGLSDYCAKLGLHAHHPRNCLFYLRDKEPHQLQTLLQMNNIDYKTEPADANEDASATGEVAGEKRPRRCPVALQRETPAGLVDTTCNSDVPPHHAGLCNHRFLGARARTIQNHYLEYLSRLVRRHAIDPIAILQTDDLETLVRRAALKLPPKPYGNLDGIYRTRLLEIVKEKIPLE